MSASTPVLSKWRSRRRRHAIAAIVVMVLLAPFVIYYSFSPSSADIRLDTGDLRYRYFGIPLDYKPMPEPIRSRLVGLTKGSAVCTPTWERCASYPLSTSNNPDSMCMSFYMKISAWIDVDANLARIGVEEIAGYITETHGDHGLPKCTPLLFRAHAVSTHPLIMKVDDDWQTDPGVVAYLESKAAK